MTKKNILQLSLILMLIFAGCGSSGDNTPLTGGQSGLALVAEADRQIKAIEPTAFIFWAGGRKRDGSQMNLPDEADTWDFNAIAMQGNQITGVWSMMHDGNSWTINQIPDPPLQIVFTDLTRVTLDVARAWSLVQAAGIAQPFFTWELFEELTPTPTNIVWAFHLGALRYIFVDTVTGEVTAGGTSTGRY